MSVRSETKPVTGMHLVVGLGGWLVYLVVLIAGIYLTQSFAGDLLGQRNQYIGATWSGIAAFVAVFICFLFSRRSWLIPVAVSSIAIACWNFPTVVEAPAIVDFVLTCLGAIAAYFVASQLDHRLPIAA